MIREGIFEALQLFMDYFVPFGILACVWTIAYCQFQESADSKSKSHRVKYTHGDGPSFSEDV